jgi:hypothetical protein
MIEPPRDDAGHALGGQRHIAQQHAGVDGEVVDALLGLLDQRVAEQLPGQVFGDAVDLLQRLVDRHGTDRHRRVADDPLAGFVDVLAGGQVHHRVRTPADAPGQFRHFFFDGRTQGAVADVAVDLHQEVTADDHRFQFGVVDVGRNDRAATGDFFADELRGDFFGMLAPKLWPACCCFSRPAARASCSFMFSRMATYSISAVMMPLRA